PALAAGAGIFASIPLSSSTPSDRVIVRIAGVSGNGFLEPGETWVAGSDVGPFASFPDARVMPAVDLAFNSSTGFLNGGQASVTYMATDRGGNQGIYTGKISIATGLDTRSPADGLIAALNPIEIINSGETINGT